jgi:neutral ceramidase
MKHNPKKTVILVILFVVVLVSSHPCDADLAKIASGPLKVGVASAVITPETPVNLAGYGGRKGPSQGVHKDVTATCVIFDNGVTRLAILALDIVALRPPEHLESLRAAAEKAGIPPQHLMVNSSHTHYAPTIGRKGSYTSLFKQRTESLFQAAVDDLGPAVLDYAVGSCLMGISKRQRDAEGEINMRPDPRKQIDPDVPVLRVLSQKGEVKAVIFGYACHPTTVGPSAWNLVNPDYPGFARDWIVAAYPSCTPVFLQGCGGDIKPRVVKPDPSGYGRFDYVLLGPLETVTEMGHQLGRAVLAAVMVPPVPVPSGRPTEFERALASPVHLAGIVEKVQLPLRLPETRPQSTPTASSRKRARPAGIDEPPRTFQMGAWRIGDIYIFGSRSEIFSQIGLRIKRECAGTRVWTNGYMFAGGGYIPDAASYPEGGHVVRGTPVTAAAEDVIVANAIRYVKALEAGKTGDGPIADP